MPGVEGAQRARAGLALPRTAPARSPPRSPRAGPPASLPDPRTGFRPPAAAAVVPRPFASSALAPRVSPPPPPPPRPLPPPRRRRRRRRARARRRRRRPGSRASPRPFGRTPHDLVEVGRHSAPGTLRRAGQSHSPPRPPGLFRTP